jgi:hypothetical protein
MKVKVPCLHLATSIAIYFIFNVTVLHNDWQTCSKYQNCIKHMFVFCWESYFQSNIPLKRRKFYIFDNLAKFLYILTYWLLRLYLNNACLFFNSVNTKYFSRTIYFFTSMNLYTECNSSFPFLYVIELLILQGILSFSFADNIIIKLTHQKLLWVKQGSV